MLWLRAVSLCCLPLLCLALLVGCTPSVGEQGACPLCDDSQASPGVTAACCPAAPSVTVPLDQAPPSVTTPDPPDQTVPQETQTAPVAETGEPVQD